MTAGTCSAFPAIEESQMVRDLLIRGMLAGILAGLLAVCFGEWFGEAQVDRAIGFGSVVAQAAGRAPEPEVVSRAVQSGIGLLTAGIAYGAGIGGLFALTFAFVCGRMGRLGPRSVAALLAALAFTAIYLIPALKYPASPPSVGEPETIAARTGLYFSMVAVSIIAMIIASLLRAGVAARLSAWNASLAGAAGYVALVSIAAVLLPAVDEVPKAFPADVLWNFRIASLGMQAVLWTTIGLVFGVLAEARLRRPLRLRPVTA
jgi:hypothetical protein